MWLAGLDFGPIRPHGQRLLCVRCRPAARYHRARACAPLTKYLVSRRIALTKLDILDTLPEIKVGVAYRVDGELLPSFPGRSLSLERWLELPKSHLV